MLKIFRKHRKGCSRGASTWDRSVTNCDCTIYVEGTIGSEFLRMCCLKTANWKLASQRVLQAEATGTWEETTEQEERENRITVDAALDKFFLDVRDRLKPPTVKKYEVCLRRKRITGKGRFDPLKHSPTLEEYCASKGVTILENITVDFLRQFRQTWKDKSYSSTKKLERLRAFFKFCVDSKWIAENPAKPVKAPEAEEGEDCPTLPFEDDELERMYATLPALAEKRRAYQHGRSTESDHMERFGILLRLMENSGLAIGDATKLDTSKLQGDRLFLRRVKTGTRVYVPLPPSLVAALGSLKLYKDRYYFWSGEGKWETAAGNYRRTLRKLGLEAKVPDAHPHRFRDTFAVRLLKQGKPLERVSRLLGHQSIKITEKHYWPWVQQLQDLLEEDVRSVWSEEDRGTTPKRKLRVISA